MSHVFLISFHVTPTGNSIMPEGQTGAYVRCYSGDASFEEAVSKSIKKFQSDGLYPEEIMETVEEMDSSQWHLHVKDHGLQLANEMMSQDEFDSAMNEDRIVYGPFRTYSDILTEGSSDNYS